MHQTAYLVALYMGARQGLILMSALHNDLQSLTRISAASSSRGSMASFGLSIEGAVQGAVRGTISPRTASQAVLNRVNRMAAQAVALSGETAVRSNEVWGPAL